MQLGDVLGEFQERFQLEFGRDDLLAQGKFIGDGRGDSGRYGRWSRCPIGFGPRHFVQSLDADEGLLRWHDWG